MKKVILFLITVMLMVGVVHADTIYPNPDEVAEDLLREQLAEEAESQELEEVIESEPQAQPVPSEPIQRPQTIQIPAPKQQQSGVAKEEKAEEKTEEKKEEPKNKLQKTKEKVKEKEEEITSKTEKETPVIPLMIGAVALLFLIALTVFLLTRKDKEDTEEDVSADIDQLYEQMQEKYRP